MRTLNTAGPRKLLFLFLFIFSVSILNAQVGSVDPTFNPVPSNPLPTDTTFQQLVQPDGKILVYGAPTMFVNGVLRSGIFRLNADGSTDTTFVYNNDAGVGVSSVAVAPDGKIILAGATAPNHAKMARLNPDGSLDNTFSVLIMAVGPPEFTGNWLSVNAIQSDGKVIATHTSWGNIQGTWYSYTMRRYNLDGSIDSTFSSPPLDGGHLVSTTPLIELLPDGSFYLAITSRSHIGGTMGITRRLANGTADPTYAAFSTTIFASAFLAIQDISIASDGGVLATGALQQTAIGFPPREQLRRFLADGSSAPGFASPLSMSGSQVHGLPDGKMLYSASGGTITRPIIRLESNGAVDSTYVLDASITGIKNIWRIDQLNRPIFLAQTTTGTRLVRLLENGAIDSSFNPVLGSVGTARVVAVQPDGKILVMGAFAAMNGVARNKLARLNADGSLDTTFDSGAGFTSVPYALTLQADGKIFAFGPLSTYNGQPITGVVRINTDGSIDNSFSITLTGSQTITAIALQPDGKILIGGSFTAINGVSRTGLARLDSTGAVDATFNPVITGGSNGPDLADIVVQSDGKITFGGKFTTVNGSPRENLARVGADGTTDTGFSVDFIPTVNALWQQADGKYLVTSGASSALSRRNSDGSVDTNFALPTVRVGSNTGFVETVVPLPDGSMLIGGSFNLVNNLTVANIARLGPNGALDTSFFPSGANASIYTIAQYQTGQVVVAGDFNTIGNAAHLGIARLNIPVFRRSTLFDFNGDGRSDFSVYRPSSGTWYELFSDGSPYASPVFGLAGDIPIPADYDGDGTTDEAIFRPSNGDWWYLSSVNGVYGNIKWGMAGDIPRPFDFDGDGKADIVVYRPSNQTWYRVATSGAASPPFAFGATGDQPVTGDFDGDGKGDMAIFRPSTGEWWYAASSAGNAFRSSLWGQSGDIPVPADYDGDGKTDHAVFRPSNGGWYIFRSSNSSWTSFGFGTNGDRPVAADYDGDGQADAAVFRPSDGIWYVLKSTGGLTGVQWGAGSDVAVPGAFLP